MTTEQNTVVTTHKTSSEPLLRITHAARASICSTSLFTLEDRGHAEGVPDDACYSRCNHPATFDHEEESQNRSFVAT
eukprot:140334-Amphidinium_carterae.1